MMRRKGGSDWTTEADEHLMFNDRTMRYKVWTIRHLQQPLWCVYNALPPFKSMSSCQLWSSQEANTICGGLMMAGPLLLSSIPWKFCENADFQKYCDSHPGSEAVVKAIKGETGSEMNMRAIKACWAGYYHHGSPTAAPPLCWWQRT